MNFEMWIMYVYHEICLHHRFYLFRSSNFKTISAVEAVISTTSTPSYSSFLPFCHALFLLLRYFWILNFSSFKQLKENKIYKQDVRAHEPGLLLGHTMIQGKNVHYVLMALQPVWSLMINKWKKKYYRLANQTGKTQTFQRGVLDHDCITM